MFVVVGDCCGGHRMITNDIDTLADIVLGLTGNGDDYAKVAHIAGEMNFGDVFVSKDYAIRCMEE